MKSSLRYILIIIALTIFVPAFGINTGDLRNIHLQDSRRYVTDPFGYMSADERAQADAIIGRIWNQTSAEVLAVVVDRSPEDDANTFATDIFSQWGIGKNDNDNGVLLLIDNENHEIVLRTGYGAEGVLPDIITGRIIRNTIVPEIQENGVGAGVIAGLSEVEKVLTNPDYADELRSKYANDGQTINNDEGMTGTDIVLCVLMLVGVAIFGIYMSRKAKGPTKCPKCGTPLEPTNPEAILTYLNPLQQTEQRIGSKTYKALRCPQDGTVVITSTYGPAASQYSDCPRCGARALKKERIVQNRDGSETVTERCLHCGNIHTRRRDSAANKAMLAILAGQALRGMMRGGLGGGFGGGGITGGSMGGGRTGGGGASGRW